MCVFFGGGSWLWVSGRIFVTEFWIIQVLIINSKFGFRVPSEFWNFEVISSYWGLFPSRLEWFSPPPTNAGNLSLSMYEILPYFQLNGIKGFNSAGPWTRCLLVSIVSYEEIPIFSRVEKHKGQTPPMQTKIKSPIEQVSNQRFSANLQASSTTAVLNQKI